MNMEYSDAAQSDENTVPYRRRISSILKAPIKFVDPVTVETPVKVAKPAEKRNSKRVSFAHDVRISKDLKNDSAGRSPLQTLIAVENPDMRAQFGVTEDRTPPDNCMETLLQAPLQASHVMNKIFMAEHNTGDYYGEKTMIFTENDASMDITRSHTMLIASDPECNAFLPDQSGNTDFTFAAKRRDAEISNVSRNIPPSACDLDPEFEDFLASISKPSNTTASSVLNKMVHSSAQTPQKTIETSRIMDPPKGHCAGRNKENKEPDIISVPKEKTLNSSQCIGQASNISHFLSEDKGMNMTEALNGNIVETAPHDEPLSCLFPTADLWFNDHRKTSENDMTLHPSKALGCTSSTRKLCAVIDSQTSGIATNATMCNVDVLTSKKQKSLSFMPTSCRTNTSFEANPSDMDMTKCHTGFTGYSDDMDITKSQTVAIDAKSLCPVYPLQNNDQKHLPFMLGSTSDLCGMEMTKALTVPIDHKPLSTMFPQKTTLTGALEPECISEDMEFTRCQTRIIEAKHLDVLKPSLIDSTRGLRGLSYPCKPMDKGTNETAQQGVCSNDYICESDDMEITRCQTVAIDAKSLQAAIQKKDCLAFVPVSSKASDISENDCNMEMTKVLTVAIDHKPLGSLLSHSSNVVEPLGADCDSDDMEFTRCQTRIIEANSIDVSKPSLISSDECKNRLLEENKQMHISVQQGTSTNHNVCGYDMEMTRCQTVAIDARSLQAVNQLQKQKRKSLAFMNMPTKASNTSEDDCNMEMTKALTVSIDHKSLGSLFPKDDNPVGADLDAMEFTRCQTRIIEAKHLDALKPSLSVNAKGPLSSYDPNKITHQRENENHQYPCEYDDMEMTKCQTVAIDARSLQAVNQLQKQKRKSLAFMNMPTKASNTSEDDCNMEMTKALTVSIDHKSLGSLFPKDDNPVGADLDAMEFTRCQTRIIEAKHLDVLKPSLSVNAKGPLSSYDPNKITHQRENENHQYPCEYDDMEMTKCQTVAIDARSLQAVNQLQKQKRKSLAFMNMPTKASNTSDDDCNMEMTKALTVSIDHKSLGSLFPKDDNPVGADSDDMEFTRCQTRIIEAKHLDALKPSLSVNAKGPLSSYDPNKITHQRENENHQYPCEYDDMEMTRCQTVAIDARSLQAVNQLQKQKRKSLAFMNMPTKASNTSEDECNMEMTKALTVSIDHKSLGSLFPKDDNPVGADLDAMEFTRCQTRIIEAKHLDALKPSLSVNAKGPLSSYDPNKITHQRENENHQYPCEYDDMEMTKCQTVAIDARSLQAVNQLQKQKRKSLAFMNMPTKASNTSDDDCNMEMTKALTVSIDHKSLGSLFPKDDNPVGADSDDMEFTRCQTRIIEAKHLDALKPSLSVNAKGPLSSYDPNTITHQRENENHQYPCESDNTEITRCHTVSFATKSLQAVNQLQKRESLSFTNTSFNTRNILALGTECGSEDMELTKCQTKTIDTKNFHVSNSDVGSAGSINECHGETGFSHMKPTSSEPVELDITRSHTAVKSNFCIAGEALSSSGNQDLAQVRITIGNLSEASNHQENCAEAVNVDWNNCTEETDHISTETNHEAISKSASMSRDHRSNASEHGALNIDQECAPLKSVECSLLYGDQFGICTTIQDSLDSKEIVNGNENGSLSQGLETSPHNSPADHKVETWTRSRRRSLADLQSKLGRISHRLNEPVENVDSTVPLAETAFDKDANETHVPVVERDPKMELTVKEDNFTVDDPPAAAASLNLRSNHFTSRRSMGSFMPKLPQKVKPPAKPSSVKSVGKHVETSSTDDQYGYSNTMDTIHNEVLLNMSIDDDVSETLGTEAQGTGNGCPLQDGIVQDALVDDVFFPKHGNKRPLPEDHDDNVNDEKRKRPPTDTVNQLERAITASDINLSMATATLAITQTVDSSNNSNTATIRSEATLESIMKQSLFESQLEEYTSDVHKKMDGNSITVLEFFKLFSLDFVIHNPRQSVLPARMSSDGEPAAEDVLKNKHIYCPKLKVYELDHHHLTEKVEGLKIRMRDRERPLKSVNRPLWEEMRNFQELKDFGAKLKQRYNWFRKQSKCLSHEMKETLYSDLRNANMEEQQNLRGKLAEADVMLKNLDNVIHEVESELSAVEGKGLEDTKPTLKSNQLALENVTRQLEDNERQIYQLDLEKKHNMDKLNRLKTETQDLQNHLATLHLVNEFKVKEARADGAIYTFLYESLSLEVVYGNVHGAGESGDCERDISDITFRLELDEERSQPHARLVHNLLSQYLQRETAWVAKYPTSRYVPKLLQDVGLVVSRLRLLGQEVSLLRKWGGLRLDLQDVRCVGSQVHMVFSSLRAFVKFEVSLSVSAAYPLYPLQVCHFESRIGDVTAERLETVVSSVSPGRKYLTRIVRRVHEVLLC